MRLLLLLGWNCRSSTTALGGFRIGVQRPSPAKLSRPPVHHPHPPHHRPSSSSIPRQRRRSSPLSSSSSDQGRQRQREHQASSREDRIARLEEEVCGGGGSFLKDDAPIIKELAGLRAARQRWDEPYDATRFSPEHRDFKDSHNRAWCALIRCCCRSHDYHSEDSSRFRHDEDDHRHLQSQPPINVFFLDGSDGGTTKALHSAGLLTRMNRSHHDDHDNDKENHQQQQQHQQHTSSCYCLAYVANRHDATCAALRTLGDHLLAGNGSGGGGFHVRCADATTALQRGGEWQSIPFDAYYLDGCGGYAPQIIQMVEAALSKERYSSSQDNESMTTTTATTTTTTTTALRRYPIVIGFSIVGGNRDVVDKEVQIVQSLVRRAKELRRRCHHVLDDPVRFGVDPALKKAQGGTLTSWFVLEPI